MKILVITKQHYTNKDLIGDCSGRLREIPLALAVRGHSVRGIKVLYEAFERLVPKYPDLRLVLAGRPDNLPGILTKPGVSYLGELDYKYVPKLFGSLDVGVICNKDNEFGKYCFPQKAYETIACRTPMVAANIGAMADMLPGYPDQLFEPENGECLIKAVTSQLDSPRVLDFQVRSWRSQGEKLEKLAGNVCSGLGNTIG